MAGAWKAEVEVVRRAYQSDKPTAAKLKAKLPAIAWSGVFEQRNNRSLLTHSGLLCLDLDGLGDRVDGARRLLVQDRHVLAVFTSPSGLGLKVIVPVKACDDQQHRACFLAAESYFKGLGLEVDATGKDVARLCFVSYDADTWVATEPCEPLSLLSEPIPTTAPAPTPLPIRQAPVGCDHVLLVRARAEAQRYLLKAKEDSPVLVSLYERVVADRFDLRLHGRNQWLTAAVPFIFRAFSRYIGVRPGPAPPTRPPGPLSGR